MNIIWDADVSYSQYVNTNWFKFFTKYGESTPIEHGIAFPIPNTQPIQRDVYFAIMPNESEFRPPTGAGGRVMEYSIFWQSIDNY
ncbi:hypothetical protein AGMMS50293_28550 [Spirochaetia bacterium]|nr:hypothetical protein AGMMS50293_28550 [Spirochaetia bacterium]